MNETKSVSSDRSDLPWSRTQRRLATCLIAFHLAAVIFAPLSMDGAFESLFRPFRFLRAYATVLYLDHGYRFFAPDPGPTHTIRFERVVADGTLISGRLPDRQATQPRLLYHRWFMLGESLATEVANTMASFAEYSTNQQQLLEDIAELHRLGRSREAIPLRAMYNANRLDYERRWQMTLALSKALKEHLAGRYPSETIRIFSRRQLIPRPYDIVSGKPLTHLDYVQEIELTDPQATLDAAKPEEIASPGGPAR